MMIRSDLIYMVSFLICHGIIILPVELEPYVCFQIISNFIHVYNYGLSQYYQELDPLYTNEIPMDIYYPNMFRRYP